VNLRRTLPIIALVYVIEGFPMGVHDLWPIYLRRHGASLTEVGLLSALGFAWTLKVLWSPLVDRFGEPRRWVASSMVVMAAAIFWVSQRDASSVSAALWIAFWIYCLASATQDVAIDAYSIGITEHGQEGPVNSMKAVAYRVGMLLASALLFLPRWIGWSGTLATAALISVWMVAAVFTVPRIEVPERERQEIGSALKRWLDGNHAAAMLVFVMLYRIGDLAMGPMLSAFWVDRGFSNEEIAVVSRGLGIGAYVLGAVLGGWGVYRMGIARSLWVFGAVALLSNLGYATVAAFPEFGRIGVYAAALTESLCGGLASAAFLSYLMNICQREHAAVQYALLTAAYRLPGIPAASLSGFLTERLDYAVYFALTAAMALPAFACLPRAARRIHSESLELRRV
jgi:PAT family beta-lactamase induction signal transducer AmpG